VPRSRNSSIQSLIAAVRRRRSAGIGDETVAELEASAGGFARRELEYGVGLAPRGRPPRTEVRRDCQHAQVAIEEDHVDREAHEGGVNRRSGPEEDPLAGRERAAAEQAANARERRVRQDTALTHHSSAVYAKDCLHLAQKPMWMWS